LEKIKKSEGDLTNSCQTVILKIVGLKTKEEDIREEYNRLVTSFEPTKLVYYGIDEEGEPLHDFENDPAWSGGADLRWNEYGKITSTLRQRSGISRRAWEFLESLEPLADRDIWPKD
jgi:hypothetical protein